jgi:hypothetical protein
MGFTGIRPLQGRVECEAALPHSCVHVAGTLYNVFVKPFSASFVENIKPARETDEIFHPVTGHSNAVKQKQVP